MGSRKTHIHTLKLHLDRKHNFWVEKLQDYFFPKKGDFQNKTYVQK